MGRWGSENGEVAVGVETADDFGAGRVIDAQTNSSQGDTSVGIDASVGELAPNVRPPRAGRRRSQNGALFLESELPCRLRGGGNLAVSLVVVAVGDQIGKQSVGRRQGMDGFSREDGRKSLLPVIVKAFDFAFGLRGRRVAKGDLVKA